MPKTVPKPPKSAAELLAKLVAGSGHPQNGGSGSPAAAMVRNCARILADASKPARARAEMLVLSANEVGLDLVPPLAELIELLDRSRALEARVAELTESAEQARTRPLRPEIFSHRVELDGAPAAVVLTAGGPIVFPLAEQSPLDLDALRSGDPILVDPEGGTIVARDIDLPLSGEVARVVKRPDERSAQALVRLREEVFTARVARSVLDDPAFTTGARVIFDPQRRFVSRVIDDEPDGSDLLVPLEELSEFRLDSLGSPHPVVGQILRRFRRAIEHPEWSRRLGARRRTSYLFHGLTGSGKSCSIKAIAWALADWLEELTGRRESCLVVASAADFYSPYFGESEAKIKTWFAKLGRLARRELSTRDGRSVRPGLLLALEECDELLRRRGEEGGSSHLFDRTLSALLRELDDLRNRLDAPIVTIATTNRLGLLDPAARRRVAQHPSAFGTLGAPATLGVLEKKILPETFVRAPAGVTPEEARDRMIREIVWWLHGDAEDQPIARVLLRDSSRIEIARRDVVTGALLEVATSQAVDACLERSEEAGELIGLDAAGVIRALQEQIEGMVSAFARSNVADHAPHLFEGVDAREIVQVEPVRHPGEPVSVFTASV